jgi:hypothetical protein
MSDGSAAGEEWKGEMDGEWEVVEERKTSSLSVGAEDGGVLPRGEREGDEGGGVGIMCCGGVRVRDRGMCDGSLAGIRWRGTV